MSNQELQDEEREVILSIYDGDTAFNQLSPVTYQYKYGQDGDAKSFLLEIIWGDNYPSEKPFVNLDTFYNNHLIAGVKEKISSHVLKDAEQWLGTPMTYSLFESLKENFDDLISEQPEFTIESKEEKEEIQFERGVKKEKKEQLSKAQKRKQWDRVDSKGERARGWNWVDVVQHLSQTGTRPQNPTS